MFTCSGAGLGCQAKRTNGNIRVNQSRLLLLLLSRLWYYLLPAAHPPPPPAACCPPTTTTTTTCCLPAFLLCQIRNVYCTDRVQCAHHIGHDTTRRPSTKHCNRPFNFPKSSASPPHRSPLNQPVRIITIKVSFFFNPLAIKRKGKR